MMLIELPYIFSDSVASTSLQANIGRLEGSRNYQYW